MDFKHTSESIRPTVPEREVDVIVIGAGPVGLVTANNLAESGLNVVIKERRAGERDANQTRAFAVHGRTLEYLGPSGVTDRIVPEASPRMGIDLYGSYGEHPKPAARADFTHLPTRYNRLSIVPQPRVEAALQDYARELNVPIHYDSNFIALYQDDAGVAVETINKAGDITTQRAKYVVGCDGSHSEVRAALNMPFKEDNFLHSMILADVRLQSPFSTETVQAGGAPGKFAFITPYGNHSYPGGKNPYGDLYRLIAWDAAEDGKPLHEAVSHETIRAIARAALGSDFGITETEWKRRFDVREAVAESYRGYAPQDRVLLAGDSAHVHSPAGGQGMNLGIGDAFNLSWRLASVIRHDADPSLLDEYTKERRPIAEQVIRSSHLILQMAITKSWLLQRLRVPLLKTALRFPPIRDAITGQLSGIGITYPRPRGAHKLVGNRVNPDKIAAARSREFIGKFVLVRHPDQPLPDVSGYDDRVVIIKGDGDTPTALVRPDGHYAWANKSADPRRLNTSLRPVLQQLCGRPSR